MSRAPFFFHRDHLLITAGAFLMLFVLSVLTFNVDFLNPVAKALESFSISDVFFDISHSGRNRNISGDIAIVDMTRQQRRGEIAMTLEEISACNPCCIGVDLIFEGERDDSSGNAMLIESANSIAGNSVFACKLTGYDSDDASFEDAVRSFFADTVDLEEGYVNLMNNFDNTPVRGLSTSRKLDGRDVTSFSASLASMYAGRKLDFKRKDVLINYRNVEFPVIPFDEVSDNQELLEGRIVLVGTVNEESDMHNSPLGKMPGIMIQAYSIDSLLGADIKTTPKWLNWILAFILCYCFQVSVETAVMISTRKKGSFRSAFSRESRSQGGTVFFIWSALLCYLLYIIFVKWHVCVEGAMFFALFPLALESRKLYRAFIIALSEKYNCKFIRTSIYVGK